MQSNLTTLSISAKTCLCPFLRNCTLKQSPGLLTSLSFCKVYILMVFFFNFMNVFSALGNVYCFNPAFRAENNQSTRHLSEFWMVEAEMAFVYELEAITNLVEDLVKHLTTRVLESGSKDFDVAYQGVDKRQKLVSTCCLCQYMPV